jgi:hypothetical protein
MAFKMAIDITSGGKLIPAGIYTVRLFGFKPKFSKNKDSVNFNPMMKIINHPEHDGVTLFDSLNTRAGFIQNDFSHMLGMECEDLGNGQFCIPGNWDGDVTKFKEDDPSTWKYDGPLLGRDGQVEVGVDTYEGKESNKIRRYICAVEGCTMKHSEDLLRKK